MKMISIMKSLILFAVIYLAAAMPQRRRYPQGYRDAFTAGSPQLVINASNSLAFDLYKKMESTGNLFFSPFSISMAMGMAYMGARNATASEMRQVLGYDALDIKPEHVHVGFKQVMGILKGAGDNEDKSTGYNIEIANAMLVDKDFNIVQLYKDFGRNFYDAAVESVSFATHPEAALASINGWVAWRTRNKIKKFLKEPLDLFTRLFLLNAVYFKGTWKTRFDQRLTMPDTFYNNGQVPKTVPMMRQKSKLNYGFISYIQSYVLELPYIGDDIKMLIILPERRAGLEKMEKLLTEELINSIPSSLREVTVQVTLPRFSLEEEYDILALLRSLGMSLLFDPDQADLTGISPEKGLHVTKVTHKCSVDVNEEGSEAAAATGVSAGVRTGGPLLPQFTADHPFIFVIRDSRTNAILFIGRLNVV